VKMSDMKQDVDAGSAQFEAGVDAGLNPTEDTRNWQAGNELGQELKDQGRPKGDLSESLGKEPPIPLFMRHTPGGKRGNAQDEKDEAAE
jgi:hypothetical protein